ncbi:DUF2201 family putative metallopeptidase [Nocardiopsis sp. EMB25]|uniref:DUF2201 family putative metallopeptidase n=1 Tax=Nocardiopsis sp. EMB25 TaxID=2835867 RepID=UPI002283A5D6|nr:hypothetical protein [Nocardiopsis sp. EMB25]
MRSRGADRWQRPAEPPTWTAPSCSPPGTAPPAPGPRARTRGAWIHEVSHLLRDHHGRADRFRAVRWADPLRANIAHDCEINDDLVADGLDLPSGAVLPSTLDLPEGLLFEECLPRLPETGHRLDRGSGVHGHPSGWEDGTAAGGVTGVEADALRRAPAEAMRAHQRSRGTLPGG